jgi:hypothetical protein
LFLFHARRVRTRTDRPHSPTLPGLPPANVAQRPKRCHTKMNARERVCVHKNKKPFASDSSSVAAVPAAPACSPFSSCRGGEKDTTRNVCSVVQPDTLVYLSTRKVSLPLSLSWGGGVGGHRQTHLRRQRVLRLLCCKRGGGAAGRGEQNNLATLK